MKISSRLVALLSLVVSFFLASAVIVAQDAQVRELDGFDAIAVGGGIDVQVQQGDRFLVEVEGDDADEVTTEVRSGTLHIGVDRSFFGIFDWGSDADVRIVMPVVRSIVASGGSDITSVGTISGKELNVQSSGGSDVSLAVSVDNVTVQTSGGADVELSGTAGMAALQTSGGSDMNARALVARAANVQSSGGSDIEITVSDSIVARASGGSDITYLGEPSAVDVSSSGGGDVRHR